MSMKMDSPPQQRPVLVADLKIRSNPTSKHHNDPVPFLDPLNERLSTDGKIVLVTGGGTSIGASTVEAFAKSKAKHIFLAGRRLHLLESVQASLSAQYHHTTFHVVRADISKENDVQTLFCEISKVGPLDILVANAGYLPMPSTIASSNTSEWWTGFEINVLGTYLLAKAFINQKVQPIGSPVYIGVNSASAHDGPANPLPLSGYATSKLAAASVVEFLQAENHDLKAFNIAPGYVKSEMVEKTDMESILKPQTSPTLAANLAVWLASPESDFLKGRFISATWDLEELVEHSGKISQHSTLFRVRVEGWALDLNCSE